MQRREVLAGLLSQGALLSVPAVSVAGTGQLPVTGRAERLWARMNTLAHALTRRLPHAAAHRTLVEGACAAMIAQTFRQLPEEEQMQPAMQALIWEVGRRIGAGLIHLSALLDTAHVGEAELAAGLDAWGDAALPGLSLDEQHALRKSLAALHREARGDGMRQRWRRELHALKRQAQRVAAEVAARGVVLPAPAADEGGGGGVMLPLLGIIGTGLIVYFGTSLFIASALTSLVGLVQLDGGLVFLGILGMLFGALLAQVGVRLMRRALDNYHRATTASSSAPRRRPRKGGGPTSSPAPAPIVPAPEDTPPVVLPAPEPEPVSPPATLPPEMAKPELTVPSGLTPLRVVTVSGEIGWVNTGVALRPGWTYTIEAVGTTSTRDATSASGPEGEPELLGGPTHVLTGAPVGMLVGRAGSVGVPFPIGAIAEVPTDQQGALQLAVNTAPGERRVGALVVKVYGTAR